MKRIRLLAQILQLIMIPCVVFFCLEYPENTGLFFMEQPQLFINLFISAMIAAIFVLIIPGIYPGIFVAFGFAAFGGIFNGFIIRFRTFPIAPADILSIQTARAVAGGYDITLDGPMWITIFVAIAAYGIILGFKFFGLGFGHESRRTYQAELLGGILTVCIGMALIYTTDIDKKYGLNTYFWDQTATYVENGYPLSFFDEFHDMLAIRPEGYSRKLAREYLKDEANIKDAIEPDFSSFSNPNPVIITVMNESFTDFNRVCDFPDSERILSFYNSMREDPGTVEWGYTYVSTRGGGTCKSEFENLSGYSMQFVPGTIPYLMYSFSGVPTYVSEYNESGYYTVAMHPFLATNWKRNVAYDAMGFDDFLDEDDYDDSHLDVRGYKDDIGNYERLIQVVREHSEPAFIINITLQNHGGYDEKVFPGYMTKLVKPYDDHSDLSVFEGMMKASDEALDGLMSEVKKLDRPVEVVFFGDHQPALSAETEALIKDMGREKIKNEGDFEQSFFATPYLIWTNYEVNDRSYETRTDDRSVISPNYLGAMARYYAGEKPTEYDGFMIRLRQTVPVINSVGYYVEGMGWVPLAKKEDLPKDARELIREYEYIQYMRMFDH